MVITGIQLYRKFKEDDIQRKRTTWTADDDEKLKSSVELHGLNNWKQVANHIDGKNTSLCFQRWAKFVNPLIYKGRWNLEEDIK
jgi:Myb-like DNA-binding domain